LSFLEDPLSHLLVFLGEAVGQEIFQVDSFSYRRNTKFSSQQGISSTTQLSKASTVSFETNLPESIIFEILITTVSLIITSCKWAERSYCFYSLHSLAKLIFVKSCIKSDFCRLAPGINKSIEFKIFVLSKALKCMQLLTYKHTYAHMHTHIHSIWVTNPRLTRTRPARKGSKAEPLRTGKQLTF
jgi:hypothetical protein